MQIQEIRELLKMTRQDIADEFSCDVKSIYNIETGRVSEPLQNRVRSYLIFELGMLKQEEYRVKTEDVSEVAGVEVIFSKCKQYFYFEVHVAFAVAKIVYTSHDDLFHVSHKPIDADKELLASETKRAHSIVKLLNADPL